MEEKIMATYTLLENNNLALTIPLSGCSEDLDRKELMDNLIETMKSFHGIGLSASQCGIMERVFVMYSDVRKGEIISCFNPQLISEGTEKVLMDEGFEFIGIEREKEYFEIAEKRIKTASPLLEFM